MNTAIIVATHGAAAGPLINTTQMIVGQQENIATIDFLPGENVDTLVTKFENVLQTLDQRDGVIFLVDIYAGSPFNAASLLSMKKITGDVITGVNVPMLINVFLERESVGEYLQLVDISKQTARDGIKSLKYSLNNNNTEEDHL